jgi:hypothetical protein
MMIFKIPAIQSGFLKNKLIKKKLKTLFKTLTLTTILFLSIKCIDAQQFTDEIRAGILLWTGSSGTPVFAITNLAGVKLNEQIIMSGGIGFAFNSWNSFLPLFADLRIIPIKADLSPVIYSEIGYTSYLTNTNSTTGGLMFSLGAGVKIKTHKDQSLNFEVGYVNQQYTDGSDKGPATLISLSIGYSF